MKKIYATPTVEFTGFDVEDVITVSIDAIVNTPAEADEVMRRVQATGITRNYEGAVHYGSYTW